MVAWESQMLTRSSEIVVETSLVPFKNFIESKYCLILVLCEYGIDFFLHEVLQIHTDF